MKTLLIGTLAIAALVAVPTAGIAATYQYVDVNGNVSAVTADSASQALTVSNLHPESGVMLATNGGVTMTGIITGSPAAAGTYLYVNTSGGLSAVQANSAAQAMTVSNLHPDSGVMLDKGPSGLAQ